MRRIAGALAVAALAGLGGCGSGEQAGGTTTVEGLSGRIVIDGAPDVAAVSESAGEQFAQVHPDVRVRVDRSGEPPGYARLCAGEVDLVHATRPPRPDERAPCERRARPLMTVRVATDGLAVIAHPESRRPRCLSLDAVRRLAQDGGAGVHGAAAAQAYPRLGGPAAARRGKLFPPDEGATVEAVTRDRGALGFVSVGYAEHQPGIRRVAVAEQDGCVEPTPGNVRNGAYRALARPVFLVARTDVVSVRADLTAFLRFAVEERDAVTGAALLVSLSDEQAREAERRVG